MCCRLDVFIEVNKSEIQLTGVGNHKRLVRDVYLPKNGLQVSAHGGVSCSSRKITFFKRRVPNYFKLIFIRSLS